jgi:HAD superfamily hydrolase (TIGR01450 family)
MASMTTTDRSAPAVIAVVLCDLDGVVWLSGRPIPGSPEAIEMLREAQCRVLFVTNNSAALLAEHEAALAAIGIDAVGDVITSAQAAARLVEPGERVHACAGPGVVEALRARGASIVEAHRGEPVDAVVVGLHLDFDYDRLERASSAVRAGARFIAANDDASFPTPDGLVPGAGAIVAAVSTASGVRPVIAGKPHIAMAALVRATVGPLVEGSAMVMIGDRLSTDGRFAEELGCRFALVRSGVTPPDIRVDPPLEFDAADLAGVVVTLLGRSTAG